MKTYDVIVIGGGPAGMMAAGSAAEKGAEVLLVEKMGSLGRKLLISGSGRCNITSTLTDTSDFVGKFGKKGRFIYPAVKAFGTAETVSFFNSLGLATTTEGDKVFPLSDMAEDVLTTLTRYMKRGGVDILQGKIIKDISTSDGMVTSVELAEGVYPCRALIIATGGKSYPKTGSSGDGYLYASRMGHIIVPPRPALVPVRVKDEWAKDLQGLSLRGCSFSIYHGGKKLCTDVDDAVFTDNGLSGPAVYNLSRMTDTNLKNLSLIIDRRPDVTFSELDEEIAVHAQENSRKLVRNLMEDFFPPKMHSHTVKLCEIPDDLRAGNMSRAQRQKITSAVKEMRLEIDCFAGFEKAVVTSGGISLKEIDQHTMRSKIIKNLYFAGEVIDLDGPTGGFNLQLCWSTGRLAGLSAAADSR